MSIINIINQLDVISWINIYAIVGIIITLLTYDMVVEYNTNYVKENSWYFADLSEKEVDNLIYLSPLLMIVCWAPFIIFYLFNLFFYYLEQMLNMIK